MEKYSGGSVGATASFRSTPSVTKVFWRPLRLSLLNFWLQALKLSPSKVVVANQQNNGRWSVEGLVQNNKDNRQPRSDFRAPEYLYDWRSSGLQSWIVTLFSLQNSSLDDSIRKCLDTVHFNMYFFLLTCFFFFISSRPVPVKGHILYKCVQLGLH